VLHKKAGSAAPLRVFRAAMRRMIAADGLPDYHLAERAGDVVVVRPRRAPPDPAVPRPSEDALEAARALRPGDDVHALAARWQASWEARGRARLRDSDAAFLGWLRAIPLTGRAGD
jgi:hypothetical protein